MSVLEYLIYSIDPRAVILRGPLFLYDVSSVESTFYPITIDFQSLATYGYIAFQIDFQDKRWINVALF